MSTTYNFKANRDTVCLSERTWDGIDKPEHHILDRLTIAAAEGMLLQLDRAIKDAKISEKTIIDQKEKDLEKEIQQKQSELDLLRKKRELEQNKRLGIEPDDDYTPI